MKGPLAVNRLVVSVDVKDSGRLGRTAKLAVRTALYEVVESALAAVGADPARYDLEDRGDGVLLVMPPDMPSEVMAGLWLEEVYEGLRERNATLNPAVQLRIAMHAGPVADDGRGLVGRAVDLACRLCDSAPAKAVLDAPGAPPLVLAVSAVFYESVVAEGGRFIEPAHYRSARVRLKETDETAWLYVPRLPAPPVSPAGADAVAPGPRDPAAHPPAGVGGSAAGDPGTGRSTTYRITVHGQNQIFDRSEIHGGVSGLRIDGRGGTAPGGPRVERGDAAWEAEEDTDE